MEYEVWTKDDERIRILRDEEAENPREFYSSSSTFVAKHRRYKLGDREPLSSPLSIEYAERCANEELVVLPVYMYDHSGITLSTSPFSCPWDSGMVGFIYAKIEAGCTREEIAQRLIGEIKTYNDYSEGNVFGFIREKKKVCETCGHIEWEDVDSCFGFYGYPEESGLYQEAFSGNSKDWKMR